MARSKVKARSHDDIAHLHPLTMVNKLYLDSVLSDPVVPLNARENIYHFQYHHPILKCKLLQKSYSHFKLDLSSIKKFITRRRCN